MSTVYSKATEIILDELDVLARLLGLDVVETTGFPTARVRVAVDGKHVVITKQGSEFLATDVLPDVPMTFVGGAMFTYRLEL